MRYVLPLSEVSLAEAGRVGRKAAMLGELVAAGFAVPDGFALTTQAVDALAAAVPPGDLVSEVRQALAALDGGADGGPDGGLVAVRSSGIDEDLDAMSYAGQYESVLNVGGLDAVLAAVRTCRTSATTERVAAYRNGHSGQNRMGVLVQVMVDASAAGVAFSANPVTGDTDEVVISAVRGLGDRLVAGEVSADEWSVRGATAAQRTPGSGAPAAIDADQARAVAHLAGRVADHRGAAQDIEWAVDGEGVLWLLQARPITALPAASVLAASVLAVPIEIEVPAGFSTRNRSMDRPWTPMEHSVFLPVFSAAVRHIFAFTTGVVPTAHCIGGWTYITVPADSPEAFARRLERIAADVAEGKPYQLVRLWHEAWKPGLAVEVPRLRDVDLPSLSDAGLRSHLGTLGATFERLHEEYFQLTGAAIAISSGFGATCAELLGWSPEQTARLRGGLVGDHMAATVGLSELARLAAGRPALRHWLQQPDADPGRLGTVDPGFAAAFADYVRRYAHRTIGFDLTEPTLAEQPAVLLALIRQQLDRGYDFAAERAATEERKARAVAQARAALRSAADRDRFEAALAAVAMASPIRDEKVYYAVSVWALLRYAVLEVGRRLVERGAVERVEDVLFLDLAQALGALSTGQSQRERVRLHRGQHVWALANPGPPAYGKPAPPVTLGPHQPLSPGAQRALHVAQSSARLMGVPRSEAGGDGGDGGGDADLDLHGLAASPGRYTGPVRVIRSITEFGKLRHGDVLVCPETTAQWSILFPSVGALVTDRGSLLSHPAIIAREYRVPAVLATGMATSVLRDDQLVVVDGTAGTVRPAVGALAGAGLDAGRAAA